MRLSYCLLGFISLTQLLTACGGLENHRGRVAAIDAPQGEWTWVPVQGAVCGNGNAAGMAVSLQPDSKDLLIFFEGGGACRNYIECFVLQTASHLLNGYSEADFNAERTSLESGWFVTNRDRPTNPFRNANMVYVPYCTGDLHAGHSIMAYAGSRRDVYHVGGLNTHMFLEQLAPNLPDIAHIWLAGYSAGGFATLLNRDATAEAFPNARIDILDDSGLAFADAPPTPASWNVHAPAPGCIDCAHDMSRRAIYAATAFPESRVAFVSFAEDTVLPWFYFMARAQFSADIAAFTADLDDLALPNLKYFIAPGANHVALHDPGLKPDSVRLDDWVNAMATDDPNWLSTKPAGF